MNNEIGNNNSIEKSLNSFDKSLFKGKDLGLVGRIISTLEENNLGYYFVGPVRINAKKKDNPRSYQYITIKPVPDTYDGKKSNDAFDVIPKIILDDDYIILDYKHKELSAEFCKNLHNQEYIRFQIQNADPLKSQTTIDLLFE